MSLSGFNIFDLCKCIYNQIVIQYGFFIYRDGARLCVDRLKWNGNEMFLQSKIVKLTDPINRHAVRCSLLLFRLYG